LTCREIADFLGEYVGGSLPPAAVTELERHLAVCPPCVAYLESYRRTIDLARRAFGGRAAAADPEVPDKLVAAIEAARLAQARAGGRGPERGRTS
jgi:anti-sigma factor RsiW